MCSQGHPALIEAGVCIGGRDAKPGGELRAEFGFWV